jgi:hypothetical protein
MRRLLVALLATLAGAPAAHAGTALEEFGNRREGIVSAGNISGRRLVLVGLQWKPDSPIREDAEQLFLWTSGDAVPLERIAVTEEQSNYRMEPRLAPVGWKPAASGSRCDEDPFAPGSMFCWPTSEFLRPHRIPLRRLAVKATDSVGRVHVPVLLSDSNRMPRQVTYEFLLSTSGATSGEWSVAREAGEDVAPVARGVVDRPAPGFFAIEWRAVSVDGSPLAPGTYHFRLEGRVYRERIYPAYLSVPFLHPGAPDAAP